ncbi:copper amine oxidase N-terminal domain-containing protein [Desulfofalx alkaliphila]|uniref:copper amine oxidase N-terminal domain-containing protein n=1 Tax=Desulfofalx alkaliphila TaxID=105483 RepID=UPI00068D3D1F|nr:copper amine oxidase N-terminal domain-containing protein [Desulfofalx alkaliphila]
MMKRMLVFFMMAMMMFAAPAFGSQLIVPGDGGGGVDNSPITGHIGEDTTPTQPQQPVTPPPPAPPAGITIIVDGIKVNPDVAPYVDNNYRTQAPFRAIGETLGCTVTWLESERKVMVEKEGFKVEMVIGQRSFTVNGATKTMDTSPVIKNGRTFIPVRYLGEALDCNVEWIDDTKTVNITSK